MQGFALKTKAHGVSILCTECMATQVSPTAVEEHMPLDTRLERTVECHNCDAEIDGEKEKPTTFGVVGAAAEVVTSWYRKVNVYYDGDVYAIELSYDHCNGYEWSELNDLPPELCDLLNEADLYYLDADARAAVNQ